jgi:hypothetical protein
MKTYIYYNKHDSSKEPQGKVQADNATEAIQKAAITKRIEIEDFIKIFNIKKYERKI